MANISTCMKALFAVSEHITTEDLESLKFLADLAGGQSEKITTPIQFISFVKEQHSNNDETVHYMIKLLDGIQRPRLSQILKKCKIRVMFSKYKKKLVVLFIHVPQVIPGWD